MKIQDQSTVFTLILITLELLLNARKGLWSTVQMSINSKMYDF